MMTNPNPNPIPNGKTALITGITGQDGSYLAELLLGKGYAVHGIIRRSSSFSTGRIEHLYHDPHETGLPLTLHYGDLSDSSSLIHLLRKIRPDEVYNLGAQSHVAVSFDMPEYTADVVANGALRLLEALSVADWPVRFYQAGSSEMYGKVLETPQKETTPFYPRSPRHVCLQRHPLQPRIAPPRRHLRHPQGHPGHRQHPQRPERKDLPR